MSPKMESILLYLHSEVLLIFTSTNQLYMSVNIFFVFYISIEFFNLIYTKRIYTLFSI